MYYPRASLFFFMVEHGLTKLETFKKFGYRIVNNYFLMEVSKMVDFFELGAGESIMIDTKDNTAVVIVSNAHLGVHVINEQGQTVAKLDRYEHFTLPYGTGKYTLTYDANSSYKARIHIVHYFAV